MLWSPNQDMSCVAANKRSSDHCRLEAAAGHHAFESGAVLGEGSSLRFDPAFGVASGIDRACAPLE